MTVRNLEHYAVLADAFDYPGDHFPERVDAVLDAIEPQWPKAAVELSKFVALLPRDDLVTMQELYIRSFDVQAITTLDIGYVLFGDDYKRGELLSNLNREHVAAKVDCGHELADHLPNVLRLLARLTDDELIDELVQQIIGPAVNKMIDEFSEERVEKKNESYEKHYQTLIETPSTSRDAVTLYRYSLRSLLEVLKADFGVAEQIPVVMTSDFLQSISSENEIEEKAQSFY